MLYVIVTRLAGTNVGQRLSASSIGRIAIEVARFVFFVGLPYAALLVGAFTARDVGLQGMPAPELIFGWPADEWTRALGQAALLSAITFVALVILSWQIRRAAARPAQALGIEDSSWLAILRDAIYAEAHWSFYRALPMVLIGDAHWAALGGLGLLTIEVALGRPPSLAPVFEALLAGLSATFFAVTGGNFWIAIGLQCVIRLIVHAMAYGTLRAESVADTM